MKLFTFLSLAVLMAGKASAEVDCSLLEKVRLSLSSHATNWANAATTKTPAGGPFKYKKVVCDKVCQIVEEEKIVTRYTPGHPDADKNGYVKYPDIDKTHEYSQLTTNAEMLKVLGEICPQKIKITNKKFLTVVEYKEGAVKFDIFNYKNDSKLESWIREQQIGDLQTHYFH